MSLLLRLRNGRRLQLWQHADSFFSLSPFHDGSLARSLLICGRLNHIDYGTATASRLVDDRYRGVLLVTDSLLQMMSRVNFDQLDGLLDCQPAR